VHTDDEFHLSYSTGGHKHVVQYWWTQTCGITPHTFILVKWVLLLAQSMIDSISIITSADIFSVLPSYQCRVNFKCFLVVFDKKFYFIRYFHIFVDW